MGGKRWWLVWLAALLVVAGCVPLGTSNVIERPGDSQHHHLRGRQALDLIAYNWQWELPAWRIDFLPGRSGTKGATLPRERRIEIYVRGSDSARDVAHVVAHEIGHALDVTYLTGEERRRFATARGYSANRWWTCSGCDDRSTGAGDFAEVWADAALGVPNWRVRIAARPTAAQKALAMQMASG